MRHYRLNSWVNVVRNSSHEAKLGRRWSLEVCTLQTEEWKAQEDHSRYLREKHSCEQDNCRNREQDRGDCTCPRFNGIETTQPCKFSFWYNIQIRKQSWSNSEQLKPHTLQSKTSFYITPDRLVELEAKIHAMEDCMGVFKLIEDANVKQVMETVRKLSKKQFRLIIKKAKLL